MEYFNTTAGGGTSNPPDPYAVIPQQFGNGGLPPPQNAQQFQFADYDNTAPDYETYQQQQQQAVVAAQQQQYRAQQQQQQSPTIYYQNQMTAAPGSYFPIHSASEHDFLGPQHPPTGTSSGAAGAVGAQYQAAGGAKGDFIIQHQQRRGNQSGQQQQQVQNQSQNQQQVRQQQQQQQQNQQQQMMGGTSTSSVQQQHQQYLHQQMQAQQAMHRLQGAPIPAHQFMVPPPTVLQSAPLQGAGGQQQAVPQMHQMQMQHPQMVQAQGAPYQQQGHQGPQVHHQGGGHHHHGPPPPHHHHHHQNQHIPHHMVSRLPYSQLKDWPIRCVVEGKYHPVIMGQNASTIRDIAHATHCRVEFVNMSKRERMVLGNNDRILTVHGHAEQASKAVARVLEVIQSEALKDDVNVGANITLRLRAHNQLCGRLIGKMGSSIKEIMSKTGTDITVAKYMEPQGGVGGLRQEEALSLMERTIVVRGPSIEAVVQAESLISAKLKKCYESDTLARQFQAQAINSSPGGPHPPLPMMHGPPGGPPNAIHPPSLIPTPQGVLQPGVLQLSPGVTTLRQIRLWVPDSMIGALIGAKGKNIKMIIRESNANIKIEAPEEKLLREAEEAEKKKQREKAAETVSAGDSEAVAAAAAEQQEFLEDSATVTSADAIEEKKFQPKPVSERLVTINGDDMQLLKAQSFVFGKIAETNTSLPQTVSEFERLFMMRLRSEVSVPTRIIGRIIGRGGQNVRELQRITGAVVKIPEEERTGENAQGDGGEEEMTMIRTFGNMHSTHNVQFRLANLITDYYRSGEHRQHLKNVSGDHHHHNQQQQQHRAPEQPAQEENDESVSPLNQLDQLGQVPPISTSSNRTSPHSSQKSKSP